MPITPRAREQWRSVRRLLRECPRDKHGELVNDDDALMLRGILRELLCELGVSPLLEPHRAGATPWKWLAAGDGEQMERWQASRDLAAELDAAITGAAELAASRVEVRA
jgi:hypothetical protein